MLSLQCAIFFCQNCIIFFRENYSGLNFFKFFIYIYNLGYLPLMAGGICELMADPRIFRLVNQLLWHGKNICAESWRNWRRWGPSRQLVSLTLGNVVNAEQELGDRLSASYCCRWMNLWTEVNSSCLNIHLTGWTKPCQNLFAFLEGSGHEKWSRVMWASTYPKTDGKYGKLEKENWDSLHSIVDRLGNKL